MSALPLSRIAEATLAMREGEVATEGEEDAGEARKKVPKRCRQAGQTGTTGEAAAQVQNGRAEPWRGGEVVGCCMPRLREVCVWERQSPGRGSPVCEGR